MRFATKIATLVALAVMLAQTPVNAAALRQYSLVRPIFG